MWAASGDINAIVVGMPCRRTEGDEMVDMTRRDVLCASTAAIATGLPLKTVEAATDHADDARKLKVVVTGGHPDDPESGCG